MTVFDNVTGVPVIYSFLISLNSVRSRVLRGAQLISLSSQQATLKDLCHSEAFVFVEFVVREGSHCTLLSSISLGMFVISSQSLLFWTLPTLKPNPIAPSSLKHALKINTSVV